MTDKAMSPLRRRTIEDMTIRKLAPRIQEGYIRTVKDLAAFLGQSPDTARLRPNGNGPIRPRLQPATIMP